MKGKILRFEIDTPEPLSVGRIGEYMVQLEKLLGVPAELIEVTQIPNKKRKPIPGRENPEPRTGDKV
jgi:hypothetical protein